MQSIKLYDLVYKEHKSYTIPKDFYEKHKDLFDKLQAIDFILEKALSLNAYIEKDKTELVKIANSKVIFNGLAVSLTDLMDGIAEYTRRDENIKEFGEIFQAGENFYEFSCLTNLSRDLKKYNDSLVFLNLYNSINGKKEITTIKQDFYEQNKYFFDLLKIANQFIGDLINLDKLWYSGKMSDSDFEQSREEIARKIVEVNGAEISVEELFTKIVKINLNNNFDRELSENTETEDGCYVEATNYLSLLVPISRSNELLYGDQNQDLALSGENSGENIYQ